MIETMATAAEAASRPQDVVVRREVRHRRDWAKVLSTTAQLTRDLDLAEECAQDAFAQALETWPRDGVPRRPGAWLTTAGRNRAMDRLRREAVGVLIDVADCRMRLAQGSPVRGPVQLQPSLVASVRPYIIEYLDPSSSSAPESRSPSVMASRWPSPPGPCRAPASSSPPFAATDRRC